MPKKEKEFPLKDMKELEELFYGKTGNGKNIDWGRFRRYHSWINGEAYSPTFEGLAKDIFSPLGEVKEIAKQKHKKTYDFRIDQAKILLETTSLYVTPTALPTTVSDDWILSKLQSAVDHVKEKDTPLLPDFFRGGLIVYETVFNFLTRFHLKLNGRLASLTGFLNDSLDFLAFAPQPASIDNISSFDQFPIVFYVKEGQLAELFRRVFKEKNYTIMIV